MRPRWYFLLGCGVEVAVCILMAIWGSRHIVRARRFSYVTCIGVHIVDPALCFWKVVPAECGHVIPNVNV